jgi:decaprenylphospho-beta-D-ribofuranose 2-oxidase
MSVADLAAPAPSAAPDRPLCGWGRTAWSVARVTRPRSVEEVAETLAAAGSGGVIARGAGCSYGDAAQNAGGRVLDMTGWDRVLAIDPQTREVRAQPGATIGRLMSHLAAHGLTMPVVPGTRHVTLAGAIASDIHGKNHHRDGALARHVTSITLCTPAHGVLTLSPQRDGDLFYATLGGMGLTGVVVEATVRASELPSPWVGADIDRTDDLSATLDLMAAPERRRYSVAWLDLLAEGRGFGRAVIERADPLPAAEAPVPALASRRHASYPAPLLRPALARVPDAVPDGLLHPAGVRAFNALRWAVSPRRARDRPLPIVPYFFPLDVLGDWNRLYGSAGLIQYQYVIPEGEEVALERTFELMRLRRLPVFLAVFKRFGPAFGGPLSFPLEGWTLAIDVPAADAGVPATLRVLDEVVAACGGRVYLTKDCRMRPEMLRAMYPDLDAFHERRRRADPEGVMRSDLCRRVGLCEEAP